MRATQMTPARRLQNGLRFTFAISPSFNWVARTPAGHDNEGDLGTRAAFTENLNRSRFKGASVLNRNITQLHTNLFP
jgi:hypothetical protein